MTSKPLLSICISTYNRIGKVRKLVEIILSCQDPRIELVVNDNASTDGTLSSLQEIDDKRFKLVSSTCNLGADGGFRAAVSNATGKFIFICLDKDSISPALIPNLCDELEYSCVGLGYCEIEPQFISSPKIYMRGPEAVNHIAYTVRHPTGYFFLRVPYAHLLNLYSKTGKNMGFISEVISADMSLIWDAAVIYSPLIATETKEEASKIRSFTYNSKNVWFSPRSRFLILNFFLSHLGNLNISAIEKQRIVARLFNENLRNCTDVYQYILADPLICFHNGIKPRRVAIYEKNFHALLFIMRFLLFGTYPAQLDRLLLVLRSLSAKMNR